MNDFIKGWLARSALYLFIVEICQNLNDLISVLVSFGKMPKIFCLTIAANPTLINLSLARSSSHHSLMQIWEAASSSKSSGLRKRERASKGKRHHHLYSIEFVRLQEFTSSYCKNCIAYKFYSLQSEQSFSIILNHNLLPKIDKFDVVFQHYFLVNWNFSYIYDAKNRYLEK